MVSLWPPLMVGRQTHSLVIPYTLQHSSYPSGLELCSSTSILTFTIADNPTQTAHLANKWFGAQASLEGQFLIDIENQIRVHLLDAIFNTTKLTCVTLLKDLQILTNATNPGRQKRHHVRRYQPVHLQWHVLSSH